MLVELLTLKTIQETYRLFNGTGVFKLPDPDTNETLDYFGSGLIVSVSDITNSSEFIHSEMTLTLSGVPPEMVSLAMVENYQNQEVLLELARLDDARNVKWRGAVFDGFVSHATIVDEINADGQGESSIQFNFVTEFVSDQNIPVSIYSSASQKRIDEHDTIFDNLPEAANKELTWGRGRLRGT